MTVEQLERGYFEWMCGIVTDNKNDIRSYRKLFEHLHRVEFQDILPMDANRKSDGESLRYRFAYEQGYEYSMVTSMLDVRGSSILEMMVALAIRCEESIMSDPVYGDRTGQWFWEMIVTLGLGNMDDEHYDKSYVDFVIYRFLDRKYEPDGIGGLFHIEGKDIRNVEIWTQMNWYLDRILF